MNVIMENSPKRLRYAVDLLFLITAVNPRLPVVKYS